MFRTVGEQSGAVIEPRAGDRMMAAPRLAGAPAGSSMARVSAPGAAARAQNGSLRWTTRSTRAPTIVVYHNLSAERSGLTENLSISTDPEIFRKHARYFARNYDLIAPSDLLGQRLPPRPLLITFDDVYLSVLDVGGPILRELNAPSIWFLNPETIQSEVLPLDNFLSWAVAELGVRDVAAMLGTNERGGLSVPAMISAYVAAMTYGQIAAFRGRLEEKLGRDQREVRRTSGLFLVQDQLSRLPFYDIQVGNHSKTHSFLRSLAPAELDTEIRGSRETLQRLSGQTVNHLAIPYGHEQDCTGAVLDVARASGHAAIYLVHARNNAKRPARDVFYRIDMGNVKPPYLPVALEVLPRVRSFWHQARASRAPEQKNRPA